MEFSALGNGIFSAPGPKKMHTLARQSPFRSRVDIELGAKPLERLDTAIFPGRTGVFGGFSIAFVVYDQASRAKNRALIASTAIFRARVPVA